MLIWYSAVVEPLKIGLNCLLPEDCFMYFIFSVIGYSYTVLMQKWVWRSLSVFSRMTEEGFFLI